MLTCLVVLELDRVALEEILRRGLMQTKIRVPEIFLGAILTVAVFATGMVTESARHPPVEQKASTDTAKENTSKPYERGFWDWVTHDAAGFFTLWLVVIGGGQVGLFYWQLRYMRRSMEDATTAALAAKESATTAREANRPWISIADVKFTHPLDSYPRGATTSIKVRTENVGRTPAIGACVWVQLIPMMSGQNLEEIHQAVRKNAVRFANDGATTAVFPTQTTTHDVSISVTQSEIEKCVIRRPNEPDRICYFLGVCVCYRTGGESEVRHTCRIFTLGWTGVLGLTSADELNMRLGSSFLDSAS